MKSIKTICAGALCLLIAMSFAACTKKEANTSVSSAAVSQTASKTKDNVYKYALGDFNIAEKTEVSEFLVEQRGEVYKDDSTGDAGFKLHYTPKYTIRRNGVRYTVVIVTMDVLNLETGNIAYVSEADVLVINDEHTEIYQASFPANGEIEIDFSKNLKK